MTITSADVLKILDDNGCTVSDVQSLDVDTIADDLNLRRLTDDHPDRLRSVQALLLVGKKAVQLHTNCKHGMVHDGPNTVFVDLEQNLCDCTAGGPVCRHLVAAHLQRTIKEQRHERR